MVKRLLDENHEVWGVDALLYSVNYKPPKGLTFHNLSVETFFRSCPKMKFDWILHLGSPASPIWYLQYPLITIHANTTDLELCLNHTKKLLFTSTSEIYGEPLKHPQKESHYGNVDPFCMRSVYDESKRLGETLCYVYDNAVVVRLFNAYGPGMNFDDGRVMINFIKQALQNEPITIYGDGTQTRSFTYIDDTISGIMTVMTESSIREVYNIGNDKEITIKELANMIIRTTNSKSMIVYETLPPNDPTRRCPDCTKIRRLGWEPEIPLITGINRMIKDVKRRMRKGEKCS